MKIALSKNGNGGGSSNQPPPLSLKAELPTEEDSLRLAKFKLRVVPAVATSATYSFSTRKLEGTEHLRYALTFMRDCKKILAGLNVTTAAEALPMIRELLSGIALAQFNQGIDDHIYERYMALVQAVRDNGVAAGDDATTIATAVAGVVRPNPSMDSIECGYHSVIVYMAPHKVLAKQKRWMRRNMRKPLDMSVREYANRLMTINNDELNKLPPAFDNTQKLSDDEIIDILTSGIPKSWIREMDKQNFDPTEGTITEVLNFCERMEAAEEGGFEKVRNDQKTNGKNGKSTPKGKPKNNDGSKHHCLLHGPNNTHDTDDCLVMKKTADSLKSGYKNKNDGQSKNKTWKRKADDNKKSTKQDLAAFVRKQARKELHAFAKKRKVDKDADDDKNDDDKSDDGSVNHMEFDNVDFSKINFDKIEEDDETVFSV